MNTGRIADIVRSFVQNEIYPHNATVARTGEGPGKARTRIKRKTIELGFYACNPPLKASVARSVNIPAADQVLQVTRDRPGANAIDLETPRIKGWIFAEFRDGPDLRVAILADVAENFSAPAGMQKPQRTGMRWPGLMPPRIRWKARAFVEKRDRVWQGPAARKGLHPRRETSSLTL